MEQPYYSKTSTADSCRTQQHPVHRTNSSCNSTDDTDSSRHRHSRRRWIRTSSLFSFLVLLHSFQSFLGSAQAAAAAPGPLCVACDDCVTSSCLRICMPSCRTAPTIAEGSDLSTEQCKHKGQDAALDIATAACRLSQATCQVSTKAPAQFASTATVSGSQCAALANAGCQKMAQSPTYSPCGANQYFGHRACSGRQFADIYKVKVGQLCLSAMNTAHG